MSGWRGDCGGEGGENGPAQPFRPPSAATLRVRIRRAEIVRAWPRSGTVKVPPSSVGPRGTLLPLSRAAFEALFLDCGAWMDVRVVLADGEEGEGGEAGGGGRSWPRVVRREVRRRTRTRCGAVLVDPQGARAPLGKSSYQSRRGSLSAGWPALVREAFRGELEAGQVLELTRQGDGRGGPGRAEVRVRVLPGASGLESTTLPTALPRGHDPLWSARAREVEPRKHSPRPGGPDCSLLSALCSCTRLQLFTFTLGGSLFASLDLQSLSLLLRISGKPLAPPPSRGGFPLPLAAPKN